MKYFFRPLLSAGLALSLLLTPAAALTVDEARDLLKTYYIDEIPADVMALTDLNELLAALGDPYTAYLPVSEYQEFLDSVNGQHLVGIGVSIHDVQDGVEILSVLPDSPALEAGFQAGSRIVAVNGTNISTKDEAQALIAGEEGTQVTLTVQTPDGSPRDYTLTRRAVTIPIVTYELVDGIPVITCSSFGETTASSIYDALEEYQALDTAWIMDLRANPGGTDQAAAGSAGWFVGGETMSYFLDGQGNISSIYTLSVTPDLTDRPLIILTSPYSASGSEMFAAAIRDHDAGISVGSRTYGKGVAQYVFNQDTHPELFQGDSLKVTVFRFYSPDGSTNDTIGVLPTLTISMDNAPTVARLLAGGKPTQARGYYKLELAGQTFYLNAADALGKNCVAAFTELLEALPPSAALYVGSGSQTWTKTDATTVAQEKKLDFHPRDFSDIQNSRWAGEIRTLASHQLIGGYEDGTFRPEAPITRGELCAILASALNLRQAAAAPFSDVDGSSWYAPAVNAMYARGLVSGDGDGRFRPNDTVSVQEVVAIMGQTAAWLNLDAMDYLHDEWSAEVLNSFDEYAVWARPAAVTLELLDALVADQAPGEPAQRETTVGLLCTLLDSIGILWN